MKTLITTLSLALLAACGANNNSSKVADATNLAAAAAPTFETVTSCFTTDFRTTNLPVINWDIRAAQGGNGYAVKIVRAVGAATGAIDHVTAAGAISDRQISLTLSDGSQISAVAPAGSPVGSFLVGTLVPADGSASRVVSCNTDQEGPAGPDRVWFLSFSTDNAGEHISLADGSYTAALVPSIPLESGICAQSAGSDGGIVYGCTGSAYSTVLTADSAQSKGTAVVTDNASGKTYQFSCTRAHNMSIMHPGLLPAGDFNCSEAGN